MATKPTQSHIPELARSPKPSSLYRDAMRFLLQKRSAIFGLVMLVSLTLIAIFAPIIAPFEPTEQLIGVEDGIKKRSGPCIYILGCPEERPQHILGVDANFRDFFSRMVYGARLSLTVGFSAVTIAILTGTILGSIAGYLGGWIDNVIMRAMDVLMAFPALILAIAIVTVLGPGLINALIAISIVTIPAYARVIRSSVITVKERDFILADRALGVPPMRILFRDVLPNAITPLIVQGTLGIGTAIVEVAALSFLGLGAQPPTPEWGLMVSSERNQVFTAPFLVFIPGIAIAMVVLGFNLLGDGLQDALNPRLNRR